MYPKKDSFSVVVIGAWNPSIFHERWILENIVEPGTEKLTIAYPLDDPTAPRKISFEGVHLFPGRKQLLLQPDKPGADGIRKCGKILSKILKLLSHTPVGPCGINFTFEEPERLAKLFSVISLPDSNDIDGNKYVLENVKITRSFRLIDENVLNFSLSNNEGKAQLQFNFHYDSKDIHFYQQVFEGEHIANRFEEAIQFCATTYELKLEELTDEEPNQNQG